jgi:hypothetical protein
MLIGRLGRARQIRSRGILQHRVDPVDFLGPLHADRPLGKSLANQEPGRLHAERILQHRWPDLFAALDGAAGTELTGSKLCK